MKTILNIEVQPNVDEMAAFLKSLPESQLRDMNTMFRGVKLGIQMAEESSEEKRDQSIGA